MTNGVIHVGIACASAAFSFIGGDGRTTQDWYENELLTIRSLVKGEKPGGARPASLTDRPRPQTVTSRRRGADAPPLGTPSGETETNSLVVATTMQGAVVVIDPVTGKILDQRQYGAPLCAPVGTGEAVWAATSGGSPGSAPREVVRVTASGLDVVGEVPSLLGGLFATGAGALWAVGEPDSTNGRNDLHRIPIEDPASAAIAYRSGENPMHVLWAGRDGVAVQESNSLIPVTGPNSGKPVAGWHLSPDPSAGALVLTESNVAWTCGTRSRSMEVMETRFGAFDLAENKVVHSEELIRTKAGDWLYPRHPVVAFGHLWIALDGRHGVKVIDAETLDDVGWVTLGPGVQEPVAGLGRLWVVVRQPVPTLYAIDPTSLEVVGKAPVGARAWKATVVGNEVWTADFDAGTLSAVDAGSGETRTIRVGTQSQVVGLATTKK
jgi:DNA-binding beta-propeller fold protein YncE